MFFIIHAALVHALVFGNGSAIVQHMYTKRSSYHTHIKGLKELVCQDANEVGIPFIVVVKQSVSTN